MKNLFNGPSHSEIVGQHATKMQKDIDSRAISEFTGLSEAEIETKAAEFANAYSQFDVPELNVEAMEKVFEKKTGRRLLEVPFIGDASYFEHSPSSHETNMRADIEHGTVRVLIDLESSVGLQDAETKAQESVQKIIMHLKQLRKDLDYLSGAAMLNTAKRGIQNRLALHRSETEYKIR